MSAKRHNKQHDARAASFKRIAKAIRASVKRKPEYLSQPILIPAKEIARIFDEEAKLLRSMR
jgi:hypothetical protein